MVLATAGLLSGPSLVVFVVLAGLVAVAWASSGQAVRRVRAAADGEVSPVQVFFARALLPHLV